MDQNENETKQDEDNTFEPPKPVKLSDSLHSFELYRDYTPPDWSAKPTKGYFLEILKNGTIIGQQDISSKPLYLVGKLNDLCDVVLEHPSISRKHAVFQHKNDGTLYLYDLGSTHGVKVNKKEIPKQSFYKLNLGDVIKFGLSTRLYIVGIDGKTSIDDYDDGAAIAEALKNNNNNDQQPKKVDKEKMSRREQYQELLEQYKLVTKGPKKQVATEEFSGVAWGMVDEALIYAYEEEEDVKLDTDILRQLKDLTPKDIEKIDNYEKKLSKFLSLEREFNELVRREQAEFGLPEEDMKRKAQIDSKVVELRTQVEIMEDNLKYQLFDEVKSKGSAARRRDEDTFGDDEFFDRTLVKKHKKEELNKEKQAQAEVETFDTLKTKLENLLTERNDVNEKILKIVLNLPPEENSDEVDALDQFMQQNDENLKKQNKDELIKNLKRLNIEIEDVQKLLRFVKPGYNFDIRQFDKKLEDKKKAEVQKSEQNPEVSSRPHQKSTHEQMRALIQNSKPQETKEDSNDQIETLDEDVESKKEKLKPKVYGVTPRPAPRNIKENEYEKSAEDEIDWTPSVEISNSKQEELRKKLGY